MKNDPKQRDEGADKYLITKENVPLENFSNEFLKFKFIQQRNDFGDKKAPPADCGKPSYLLGAVLEEEESSRKNDIQGSSDSSSLFMQIKNEDENDCDIRHPQVSEF